MSQVPESLPLTPLNSTGSLLPALAVELDDDLVFGVLRQAVNLARERQIRRLDTLRSLLNHQLPGRSAEIEAAIRLWANYVNCRGERGRSN